MANKFLKLKYVYFGLLKSKNETNVHSPVPLFQWMFLGINLWGQERQKGRKSQEGRDGKESLTTAAGVGS